MGQIFAADGKQQAINGWYADGETRYVPNSDAEKQPATFSIDDADTEVLLIAAYDSERCTVTYTDGVEDEDVFEDQVYTAKEGDKTPAFEGTPTREGYSFAGWEPEVAESVTENATYTAQWTKLEEPVVKYTVTYTDGVDGEEVFKDQVYTVEDGGKTPEFDGKPTRKGYKFSGWEPKVADTVTKDVTYTAEWTKLAPTDPTEAPPAKTGDNSFIGLWTAVMLLTMAGASALIFSKKKAR